MVRLGGTRLGLRLGLRLWPRSSQGIARLLEVTATVGGHGSYASAISRLSAVMASRYSGMEEPRIWVA